MTRVLAHGGGVPEFVATILAAAGLVAGWVGVSRLRGRGFGSLPRPAAIGLATLAPVALVASVLVPSWIGPQVAEGPRPRSTATIAFVEPRPGATVRGTALRVHLDLEGGRIVEETTTDLAPDTGHLHVFLDGELTSMTYGVEQDVDVGGLSPGAHELTAEYVAADHAPFSPRVTATVTFVKAPA